WLNYYQNGFLHTDIGVSNILKLKVPATRTPFSARLVQSLLPRSVAEPGDELRPLKKTKFVHSVEETSMRQTITPEETRKATEHHDAFWVNLLYNTESQDARAVVNEARQVEEKLKDFGLGQDCKAILNDCDMAAKIDGYFLGQHEDSLSGTYEFMSSRMRRFLEEQATYTHSPIDDFHSFFWTTSWAALNNAHTKSASDIERLYQRKIQSEDRDSLIDYIKQFGNPRQERTRRAKGISKFFDTILPMLRDWLMDLDKLQEEWDDVWDEADESTPTEEKELVFHRFAYRVVSTYLTLLDKHKKRLQEPFE
ncbi:hypothetical protein H0H93_001728, partial [Arthromyces matolae]